jgi:hypothetical protein
MKFLLFSDGTKIDTIKAGTWRMGNIGELEWNYQKSCQTSCVKSSGVKGVSNKNKISIGY